jgi:hypothetical protein
MSNVQEHHGYQDMLELEVFSDTLVKDGLRSNQETPGDQSHLTTSGIMTMVPELSVKTSDMEMVREPEPEIHTTEEHSIQMLDTEDVLLLTQASSNAESMVDQTKVTEALKLMLNVGENHGRDNHSERLVVNSPSMVIVKVGSGESTEVSGDQSHPTTSGITTMVLKLFAET